MGKMVEQSCCDRQSFVRLTAEGDPLTDPGKAGGVEFTLGTCANCGRYLVHCWVASGVAQGHEVVDRAFVEKLRAASYIRPPWRPGTLPELSEREKILAAWWNDEIEGSGRRRG